MLVRLGKLSQRCLEVAVNDPTTAEIYFPKLKGREMTPPLQEKLVQLCGLCCDLSVVWEIAKVEIKDGKVLLPSDLETYASTLPNFDSAEILKRKLATLKESLAKIDVNAPEKLIAETGYVEMNSTPPLGPTMTLLIKALRVRLGIDSGHGSPLRNN